MDKRHSILVVDDDVEIMAVCAAALRFDGYAVEEAHGGTEAIEKASGRYDIVLTDLMMPQPDGIAVLRFFKSRAPSTDVIIMTALPTVDSAIAALKEGAYDYLRKPFKKEELRAVVRRCADIRAARAELAVERQLKSDLEAAYRELKRMEQLKEGFISRVSHELRTPLAQVLGCLEIIERGRHDAACTAEKLKSALDGARRLREVVEDIISFAEIQEPGIELEKTDVDIEPIITRVVEDTMPEWQAKRLKIATHYEAGGIRRVMADPGLIEKAMRHLVLNAIRFNKVDGAVDIIVHDTPEGVEIMVRDTGEGVPFDQRQTIFDAFYQIAEFMTRKVRGLGLGLALVKRIAEAHGGAVLVDSVPGEGSSFSLRLPS